MLYLVGLGLAWKDISLCALEILSNCEEIYLESYTSISDFSVRQLERLLGKQIVQLGRRQVEEEQPFLKSAHLKDVALLVYGDPLIATTHQQILLDAKKAKVKVQVIHAPSILTAIAQTGLSLYRFGKIASIPIPERGYAPESFYDVLVENRSINAHTLFLLDLKPEKKRFLDIPHAIKILRALSDKRKDALFTDRTFCIGCARLGMATQKIKAGSAKELITVDWGKPPYCLIVPAELNFKEKEFLYATFNKKY